MPTITFAPIRRNKTRRAKKSGQFAEYLRNRTDWDKILDSITQESSPKVEAFARARARSLQNVRSRVLR